MVWNPSENWNEILASVAKQLGLIYSLPLGMDLVYTVFVLLTYNRMMEETGKETPTQFNAVPTVLVFLAVYAAFHTFLSEAITVLYGNGQTEHEADEKAAGLYKSISAGYVRADCRRV